MNEDLTVDDDNAILAQLALELESSSEVDEVMRRCSAQHPHLAQRIHELCETWLLLQKVGVNSTNLEGRKLGSFTLNKWLGQGMSVVYAATEDPPLSRRVAIKIMRPDRRSSSQDESRFELEQKLLAQLNDPHIVPIIQTGFDSGLQYFVMPFIEGATLGHVVRAAHEITTIRASITCPSIGDIIKHTVEQKEKHPDKDTDGAKVVSTISHGVRTSTPAIASQERLFDRAQGTVLSAKSKTATTGPLCLSKVYFRSVAKVLCEAATAVDHVHMIGVLHRDIKPSNIMVTANGDTRLIDLGLAARFGDEQDGFGRSGDDGFAADAITKKGTAICGTPKYMAPEQFRGHADRRTDVWGLGVTLCELLTLRYAFASPASEMCGEPSLSELRSRIETHTPAPRCVVKNVPRALEAICLKALHKDPAERYQSAAEFAADLKRWHNGEPCHAWPPGWNRRLLGPRSPLSFWALCRKWPAATSVVIASILGLLVAITFLQFRAAAAERQLQLHELQQKRSSQSSDWSQKAWTVAQTLSNTQHDALVRDEAAATLMGWDAKRIKTFKFPASSLAYSPDGNRLLMGGWTDYDGVTRQPARLWNSQNDQVVVSQQAGTGPVCFDTTGAPLQLITEPTNRWRFLLWDMQKQELRQSFLLSTDAHPALAAEYRPPIMAASPDGKFVAASAILSKDMSAFVVWEAASGREVHRDNRPLSAIAFSPDGALLAAADDRKIVIRNTTTGDELVTISTGRAEIEGLAFGRDPRPLAANSQPADAWRLAASSSVGRINIWSLRDKVPIAQCLGSNYNVYSVDFSPDGTLLVSTGRKEVRLWDVATGRLLLTFGSNNTLPAVKFSPDGNRVAVSAVVAFGSPSAVEVWQLENGRGILTLHGLAGPVAQVCFSPGGRCIAALSLDWQVGVWDLATHRLRHLFEAPMGYFADNAALAFSADEGHLAYSTVDRATLWDLNTGQTSKEWSLPPGLGDRLAYDSSGRLLSMRSETVGKKLPPVAGVSWKKHPRVIRLRNLLGSSPLEPIREITTFNRHVFQSAMARNGSYFVVEGCGGPDGKSRSIRAYDGLTGNEVWTTSSSHTEDSGWLQLDPQGQLLALSPGGPSILLVKLPGGQLQGALPEDFGRFPEAMGPGADYRVNHETSPRFVYCLRRGNSADPVANLGLDIESDSVADQFNAQGTHFAWGNTNGTVSVCDLRQVQARLTELGFGW